MIEDHEAVLPTEIDVVLNWRQELSEYRRTEFEGGFSDVLRGDVLNAARERT